MEARRLEMERAERLREVRVRDQFLEASGNIRESVEIIEGVSLDESSVVILQLERDPSCSKLWFSHAKRCSILN